MSSNLITLTNPTSPAAEAYRRLRLNLMAIGREAPLRTLLVVAAGADEDKAVPVANLAVTFARVGQQVILADCDLRHPAQHTLFGLANTAGVTTVLQEDPSAQSGQPREALPLQPTKVRNLRLLSSGPAVEIPSDLIATPAMVTLISRLRDEADIVLFDAPPVTLATDAAMLATRVDGVLLTVSAGRTKQQVARQAKDLLERVGARLVGVVLVNVPMDARLSKYLSP